MTNTQRTLKYLKEQGYTCGMVEKWNPHVKIRQDLFGIIDIIAMQRGILIGVQSCAGSGHAAHRNKIYASPHYEIWRTCAPLWLISWTKKNNRWQMRLEEL